MDQGNAGVPLLPGLRQRRRYPEIMDQPGLDEQRHHHALSGLNRFNRISGSARILWPTLRAQARLQQPRPLRVLDIATGGGDIPIDLWQRARREGLPVEFAGCDLSPQAVAYARDQAQRHQANLHFFQQDALNENLPTDYDIIICSLFLHHLDEDHAVELLRRMAAACGQMIVVNDLVRNSPCYLLVYLGSRILTTSDVVRYDGPRSVQAAFTVAEARELAARAGLDGATVVRRYPCRFLLTWRKG